MISFLLSMGWLMAAEGFVSAGGVTLEDFLKKNGIDPKEPAFVRLVLADLPTGCEKNVVEAFVETNKQSWSSLQREQLHQDLASPDGYARVELVLLDGKPSKSTLMTDSTDSIALMERLQADFATIVFAKQCRGTAQIELRFHLPSS